MDNKNLDMLVQQATNLLSQGRYKSLSNVLGIIAYSGNKQDILLRLEAIKKGMPIYFDAFEKYYFISSSIDPRRSINFRDIGRVRFNLIPSLYEKYVMAPLNEIAIELISQHSRDKGATIANYISSKSSMMNELKAKEPEVILDG